LWINSETPLIISNLSAIVVVFSLVDNELSKDSFPQPVDEIVDKYPLLCIKYVKIYVDNERNMSNIKIYYRRNWLEVVH
jgi:hypothetical protein